MTFKIVHTINIKILADFQRNLFLLSTLSKETEPGEKKKTFSPTFAQYKKSLSDTHSRHHFADCPKKASLDTKKSKNLL